MWRTQDSLLPKGDSPAFLCWQEHGVRTPHGEQHWGGGREQASEQVKFGGTFTRASSFGADPGSQSSRAKDDRWCRVKSKNGLKMNRRDPASLGASFTPSPGCHLPPEPSLHLHLAPWIVIVCVSTVCQVVTSSLARFSDRCVEALSAEAVWSEQLYSSCKDCRAFL